MLTSHMPICAAVDSNALTYLVNAIGVEGYDPARDTSGLADERIAMSRLFMYGDLTRQSAFRSTANLARSCARRRVTSQNRASR